MECQLLLPWTSLSRQSTYESFYHHRYHFGYHCCHRPIASKPQSDFPAQADGSESSILRPSDYLRNVHMEIQSAFFPPPNVFLPNVDLRLPGSSTNANVTYTSQDSFAAERRTIAAYEREEARRRDEAEIAEPRSDSNDDSSCNPSTTSKCGPSLQRSRDEKEKDRKNASPQGESAAGTSLSASYPHLLPTPLQIVSMTSTRDDQTLNGTAGSAVLKEDGKPSEKKAIDLEEFMLKDSVFDILARSSINDRAELEKLLS